jgi:hypothetical protein
MNKLGLFGGGFQHAYSSTLWKKPSFFEWAKNTICDYNCFVEEAIVPNMHRPVRKFAWLVENSYVIEKFHGTITEVLKHADEISKNYDFLISHDKRVYSLAPNFFYVPPHGTWIEHPLIYNKKKLCSMVSSNKRQIDGHDFRLDWVRRLHGKLDLYGSGINPFKKKEEALCDYMFSVTMESAQYPTYWTEKILDCFATGTVPIYYGSPDIGEYFNTEGIILLTDDFDPSQLSPELYASKRSAIEDNFKRSLQYNVIEDILWEKFLKDK